MFPTWRIRLREARMAWRSGRYDEASALLMADSLREFLPAKQLAKDVATKVCRTGRRSPGTRRFGWPAGETSRRPIGSAEKRKRLPACVTNMPTAVLERSAALSGGGPDRAGTCSNSISFTGTAWPTNAFGLAGRSPNSCRKPTRSSARGHFAEASAAIARATVLATSYAAGKDTMDEIVRRLNDESDRLDSLRCGMSAAVGRNARSA